MALTILGCGGSQSNTPTGDYSHINIRWATLIGQTSATSVSDQWYADQITKKSGGKVTFSFGYSGAFGGATETVPLLQNGTVGIATAAAGTVGPNALPFMTVLSGVSFLFDSPQKANKIGSTLMSEFSDYQLEAQAAGLRLLWNHSLPLYVMLQGKPACTLDQLKGTSLRPVGTFAPAAYKAVGINPVNVLPADWYTALARGTVDSIMLPADIMQGSSLQEAGKYLCTATLGTNFGPQVYFSQKVWDTLTPATQALFTDVAKQAPAYDLNLIANSEKQALAAFKKAGVHLLVFPAADQDKWKQLAPDAMDTWVTAMTTKGKGTQAQAIADRYKKLLSAQGGFKVDTSVYVNAFK
jgi:TRAP-type C4-dicarboxylate transport system substrate-binding protein